ncbi:Lethal(2)neighbour of tid protein [Araneus ventricosus]|uniref:dolichyl-P-Man:Man5GlcNAc2-PP-dolichol alpha-1,3-mannosyltransferase n=1 Tax=Araneus ventricosus TaxID=182803 RepID=A0A4Y2LAW3_ARAVE|nr:Lethal(2)neighbour of tid protein [Araneus ventricosus]
MLNLPRSKCPPVGFVWKFGDGQRMWCPQHQITIENDEVPPYALIFMCFTSYRIHSIYVLRLFNDPVAIFFLFVALNFFSDDRWFIGCIFYSFAVSVKMNILLFAPGLLFILLHSIGIKETVYCLSLCGLVQVLVGLPFLLANPVSYISRAFDLGRIFLHQWTVNWRFVPEEIFVSRSFHLCLLVLHLVILAVFAYSWTRKFGLLNRGERRSLALDSILFSIPTISSHSPYIYLSY